MGSQSWRPCWRLGKEGQSGEGTGDASLRMEGRHGVAGEQPHMGESRGVCGWKGAQQAVLAGTS